MASQVRPTLGHESKISVFIPKFPNFSTRIYLELVDSRDAIR